MKLNTAAVMAVSALAGSALADRNRGGNSGGHGHGHVQFSGNRTVNYDTSDESLSYRSVTLVSEESALFGDYIYYKSVALDTNLDNDNTTHDGSLRIQAGLSTFPGLIGKTPVATVLINSKTSYEASSMFRVNMDTSYSFAGSILRALVEVDSEGNDVLVTPLQELTWDLVDVTSSDEDLAQIDAIGTLDSSNLTVTITHIASKVVGTLNVTDALVTPTSLETLISISDYDYANSTNSLKLMSYVAVGGGNTTRTLGHRSKLLSAGSGADTAYVHFANDASVDGETQSVNVSCSTHYRADNLKGFNGLLMSLLKSRSDDYTVQVVNVTFSAGAAEITYDPSYGGGESVSLYESDGSDSSAATGTRAGFALVLVAALSAVWAAL